mmetsp:Transcript_27435/g.27834  ORF Transcript_27435/g.27834 Transcript_27435/m.27834 type:complete len:127 (-) Transcript_27435:139-519(-)
MNEYVPVTTARLEQLELPYLRQVFALSMMESLPFNTDACLQRASALRNDKYVSTETQNATRYLMDGTPTQTHTRPDVPRGVARQVLSNANDADSHDVNDHEDLVSQEVKTIHIHTYFLQTEPLESH